METKKARSSAKGIVTKKIKEISGLMTDETNVNEVIRKSAELEEAFKKFQEVHEEIHSQLEELEAIEESGNYYELVLDQVKQLQENIDLWLAGVEASRLAKSFDVNPEDSVSNIGSRSVTSHTSRSSRMSRSSSASARARAAARKAILEAEVATLKRLHQIEEEELKLRQRKNQLKLETEMAKAEAEEIAYAQAEREMAASLLPGDKQDKKGLHVPPPQATPNAENLPQVRLKASDPAALETKPDALRATSHGLATERESSQPSIMAETPQQIKHLPLNPEVPEWRNKAPQYSTFEAVTNGTPQATLVPAANSDIQLLLRQQQEAIMALTLPQPDVPIFNGDPVEYCDFTRAFENLIEAKTSSPSSRLYYLLQYTSGQVQDLVRSCLAMKENKGYDEARKLLAERYGQSYKIATAYVDRVINGQPIRAEDGPALQRFSILLTSCSNTLKEIGYLNRLENPDSLRKIVDRLPYPLRLKWRKLVDSITQRQARDPNLRDITDFVEAISRVTNHASHFRQNSRRTEAKQPKIQRQTKKRSKVIRCGRRVQPTQATKYLRREKAIEVSLL